MVKTPHTQIQTCWKYFSWIGRNFGFCGLRTLTGCRGANVAKKAQNSPNWPKTAQKQPKWTLKPPKSGQNPHTQIQTCWKYFFRICRNFGFWSLATYTGCRGANDAKKGNFYPFWPLRGQRRGFDPLGPLFIWT